MSKTWNVKIDDYPYVISVGGSKVTINNEKTKLKNYLKKRGWIQMEYEIPVGSKKALLVVGGFVNSVRLIIDGKDCATGEDYVPMTLPKWAYIFIALHALNLMNGAIGALLAIAGISLTASISSNPRLNTAVKVILDILMVVLAVIVVFAIAIAIAAI